MLLVSFCIYITIKTVKSAGIWWQTRNSLVANKEQPVIILITNQEQPLLQNYDTKCNIEALKHGYLE